MARTQPEFPTTFVYNNDIYRVDRGYDVMTDSHCYVIRDAEDRQTAFKISAHNPTEPTMLWLITQHERAVQGDPDYRHLGPSNRELANPAIAQAWAELKVMMRLCAE